MKPFYVISALLNDSSPLGRLRRWETEAHAIDHAKGVIQQRARDGQPTIAFHVLKVVAVVEPATPPVKVTKLK